MDWQSLALGASLPPLLWLLSKGISVLMSDPKANREVLCLKVAISFLRSLDSNLAIPIGRLLTTPFP